MLRVHHVGGVNVLRHAHSIDGGTAKAPRSRIGRLRRQLKAGVMHCILPSRPCLLPSIFIEVGFGTPGEIDLPSGFEISAGLIEGRRGTPILPPAMRQRIEAAIPAPLVNVVGDAGALRDHANTHVAIVNVPALLLGVGRSAAGELGHPLLKRGPGGWATGPTGGTRNIRQPLPVGDVDKPAGNSHRSGTAQPGD